MRAIRYLTVVLAAGLLLTAWIASAPPASNPDGVYHLVSIWCAEGTNEDDCVSIPGDDDRVLVPRSVQQAACYAYDALESGACAQQFMMAPIDVLAPSARGNLGGERPGLYYRVMHLLKGEETLSSVTRMRATNAALGVLLIAATSFIAPPGVRRGFHASWLLTSIPLGVWLLSTTNTGAWLVAGAGTAWANALTTMDPSLRRSRRGAAGALALVGTVMALGARTEAAVPIVIGAVAIAVLRAPGLVALRDHLRVPAARRRFTVTALTAIAGLAVVIAVLPQTATLDQPLAQLSAGLEELRARGAGNPVLHLVVTVPSLLMGGLGVGWGLGWIDTLIPVPVGGIVLGSWSAVLVLSMSRASVRQRLSVTLLLLTAVAFPVLTLASFGLYVGEQFQPRHFVVLLFLTMGFAALGGPDRARLISGGQRVALVAALALAHAHLLHQNTRRYVTGLRSEVYFDLGRDATWWWMSYPLGPTTNWLLGSAAFVVVAWALSRSLALGPEASPPTQDRWRAGGDAAAVPPSRRG